MKTLPPAKRLLRTAALVALAALLVCAPVTSRVASAQLLTDLLQQLPLLSGEDKLSPDLRALLNDPAQSRSTVRVVVQLNTLPTAGLFSLLDLGGLKVTALLSNLNVAVLELPVGGLRLLAALNEVVYISGDYEFRPLGHVTATTGTDAARGARGPLSPALDGTGVAIAVADSGIYRQHRAFRDSLGQSRVVVNIDFTGEGRTDDPYGHGTHVA
ncbi:MAG TPA: hypothetical protein VEQ42_05350, partial [Pyrinomonadaceae bacterium]|nr:hypothetical protein [Pyrinomonadaceae bacterium]